MSSGSSTLKIFMIFRHLLLSAGSQFTEELWHILCKGIKQIIDSTLLHCKELCSCFESGSTNVGGDNGLVVKIVARRDVTPIENKRLMQIAEQVCKCLFNVKNTSFFCNGIDGHVSIIIKVSCSCF